MSRQLSNKKLVPAITIAFLSLSAPFSYADSPPPFLVPPSTTPLKVSPLRVPSPVPSSTAGLPDSTDTSTQDTTQQPSDTSAPVSVSVFSDKDENEKFMKRLLELRRDIIFGVMESKLSALDKRIGGKFPILPKGVSLPEAPGSKPVVKKPAEKPFPVKLLTILSDKILVEAEGERAWVTLGSPVDKGKYTVKAISDKTATLTDIHGKLFVLHKAPTVVPRPQITVQSVDMSGKTANVVYNNESYTVSLNSPLGDSLTVTALSSTQFSVTDSHGRVFTYPVPVTENKPSMGYMPPPMPQQPMRMQQQNNSNPLDENF